MNIVSKNNKDTIELHLECNAGEENNIYIYRQCMSKKQLIKTRVIQENLEYKLEEVSSMKLFCFSSQNNTVTPLSETGFDSGIIRFK